MTLRNIYSFLTIFLSIYGFAQPITGAQQTSIYIPLLKEKSIAVVVNQTSVIGTTHLVDSLISLGVSIKKIFAPEHGFRGTEDAGAHVSNGIDSKTGIPIISLYGKNKKPTSDQLKNIDVVVFDIQDVGVRFYTYISTMHYVMEACAENSKECLILDRPNPNGMYVDGPILDLNYQSFVGMHPIPILHGLTVGELAQMINGEKWLANGAQCSLQVIKCINYSHKDNYTLEIKPSPNLPNNQSIMLYPSLCLFEGTNVSVGRGTDLPFQQFGHPHWKTNYSFKPVSTNGASQPLYEKQLCFGVNLKNTPPSGFTLSYLIEAYKLAPNKDDFFLKNGFINKLYGNNSLINFIQNGLSEDEIRATWEPALGDYKAKRKKYLLYPED